MVDEITFDMEIDALVADMTALGDALQPYVNHASGETAERVEHEAERRLARQLSQQATGKTLEGIGSEPANDGDGYVVYALRDPYPELPLWLEKGTKPGKRKNKARVYPLPFFYISVELEQAAHFRRIQDAVQACLDDRGLGEAA